jgi:hypothetical protein
MILIVLNFSQILQPRKVQKSFEAAQTENLTMVHIPLELAGGFLIVGLLTVDLSFDIPVFRKEPGAEARAALYYNHLRSARNVGPVRVLGFAILLGFSVVRVMSAAVGRRAPSLSSLVGVVIAATIEMFRLRPALDDIRRISAEKPGVNLEAAGRLHGPVQTVAACNAALYFLIVTTCVLKMFASDGRADDAAVDERTKRD